MKIYEGCTEVRGTLFCSIATKLPMHNIKIILMAMSVQTVGMVNMSLQCRTFVEGMVSNNPLMVPCTFLLGSGAVWDITCDTLTKLRVPLYGIADSFYPSCFLNGYPWYHTRRLAQYTSQDIRFNGVTSPPLASNWDTLVPPELWYAIALIVYELPSLS